MSPPAQPKGLTPPDTTDTPPANGGPKSESLLMVPSQNALLHKLLTDVYGKDDMLEAKKVYKTKYNVTSIKDLTIIQAGEIISELQSMVDEKPEPVAEEVGS